MYPVITCPDSPTLVSALMDDRISEAAAARLAASLPQPELETPRRFRRLLADVVRRPTPSHHLSPAIRHH